MKRILAIGVIVVATLPLAVPGQQTTTSKTTSTAEERCTIPPPVADYHAHLLSPAAAKLNSEPPLPAIELPEDLARLLSEMEKGWNNKVALTALYTEDSLVIRSNGSWIRGRDAVAADLAETFARPYRVTPIAYKVDGSAAHIAGYFTRGDGATARHFGHVLLSLNKQRDGVWRIAAETLTFPGPTVLQPIPAEQLIARLDDAGIQRAAVLSVAYWFGSPLGRPVEDEHAKVRAENDWVAREVARFPNRLVGFCSFNPLKAYALQELERCQNVLHLKGLKLHLGNSGVDVRKAEHTEKLRQVFRTANERRMPIVIHLWTNPAYETEGGQHAKILLDRILPEATDVTVQIAHMAGGGRSTDSALAVFAEAIAAGDPRTKNLYFDVATLTAGQSDEGLRRDAVRMRQIGLQRILYGTDMAPPNPPARESWATFRARMPLTDDEFRTIASNVAPYLR